MEEAGFEYDEQSEQSFKTQVEHFYARCWGAE
jgi:hypothetical protein